MKPFVPWRLFIEALANQIEARRQRWLGLWLFDDYGVKLRPELAGWQEIPPSLREAFALVVTQKEPTIH